MRAWIGVFSLSAIGSLVPNLRRQFGDPAPVSEATSGGIFMDSLWQDVRFGWRAMRKRPLVTGVALLSLPRDLKVPIPGHGEDKINTAYTFGGPKLTIKTVAVVAGEKGEALCLRETTTGKRLHQAEREANVRWLAFSPNGKALAIPANEREQREQRPSDAVNGLGSDEDRGPARRIELRRGQLARFDPAASSPAQLLFR